MEDTVYVLIEVEKYEGEEILAASTNKEQIIKWHIAYTEQNDNRHVWYKVNTYINGLRVNSTLFSEIKND